MIGENAKQPKKDNFTDRAQRLNMMLHAFMLAEAASTKEFPLLNTPTEIGRRFIYGARVYSTSDVHMGKEHELLFAVGDTETDFYQLPLIQVAKGIDAKVTGRIDLRGNETCLDERQNITDIIDKELCHGQQHSPIERTFAVALVPKTDYIGTQLLLAAGGNGVRTEFAFYRLALNGFLSERVFVTPKDGSRVPLLVSKDGQSEHFLQLSDVVHEKDLKQLEAQGVLPGIYVVGGEFIHSGTPERTRALGQNMRLSSLSAAPYQERRPALDMPLRAEGSELGRIGVDVGKTANVQYERTHGLLSKMDSLLAIHLLPITTDMDPARIQREIRKYTGAK